MTDRSPLDGHHYVIIELVGMMRTGEGLCLLGGHGAEVLEIGFVANEHDDDVGVGMVSKFLQPPRNVDVRSVFRDVVDE